jgi:hypothetical protein
MVRAKGALIVMRQSQSGAGPPAARMGRTAG